MPCEQVGVVVDIYIDQSAILFASFSNCFNSSLTFPNSLTCGHLEENRKTNLRTHLQQHVRTVKLAETDSGRRLKSIFNFRSAHAVSILREASLRKHSSATSPQKGRQHRLQAPQQLRPPTPTSDLRPPIFRPSTWKPPTSRE